MYAVSDAYKAAISAATRTDRITGTITLSDSTVLNITNADIAQNSLYIDERCISTDDLDIGAVEASELGLALVTSTAANAFNGAEVNLNFGIETDGPVTNVITNGNFVNGTTGWSAYASTHTVSGGILTNVANGAAGNGQESRLASIPATAGHKYYLRLKARVTNALCALLYSCVSNEAEWPMICKINNPIQNQWYVLSGIASMLQSASSLSIYAIHEYADAATANGKAMEIDGNYGVMCIDLTTAFGAGNEPTTAQMDAIVDANGGWWDGTIHIQEAQKVWEVVPLGLFYVVTAERQLTTVRLTCLDRMMLFSVGVGTPPSTGTPYDYINYCCTSAGVTLATGSAAIGAMPNGGMTITYPSGTEIITCRDLLMWVVQLLAAFAWINRDGQLEIRQIGG